MKKVCKACEKNQKMLMEAYDLIKTIPPLSYEDIKELDTRNPGEDENFDRVLNLGFRFLAFYMGIILGHYKEASPEFVKYFMETK